LTKTSPPFAISGMMNIIEEDFPSGRIFKSDLSKARFQTYFGGGNPNVIDFHPFSPPNKVWNLELERLNLGF
jgi:hypothetical protein